MEQKEAPASTPPESKFPEFFELLHVQPDPRVEKVLAGVLSHESQKYESPADALNKLLGWKHQHNIVVVDGASGGLSTTGRFGLVLDENFHPQGNIEVHAGTGEHGKTDEHGQFILHESWVRCKLTVKHGEREYSQVFEPPSQRIVEDAKETLSLYLLTDLDQYRPSQSIHVRGIAWRSACGSMSPVKDAIAIISLINMQSVEVARHRRATDDFGVFDIVIETDFMIREGAYRLRFEFPEYKHVVEKPITIKNFTPPTIAIEAPSSVDVETGKDIMIPLAVKYFYGDPVAGASCTTTVSNATGDVAEAKAKTGSDGTITVIIPTATLAPGSYDIIIHVQDAAGRVSNANVHAMLWTPAGKEILAPRSESVWNPRDYPAQSTDWDFTASIDAQHPGKCNISFIVKDAGPSWHARPAFIYWTASGNILASDILYPGHSAFQPIDVPQGASGLVTLTLLRIDQNGHHKIRGRRILVLSRNRTIGIHVDGPEESRPGSKVSLGIRLDPPHDRKQVELGAMLVDMAARGRYVPVPFSEISEIDQDGIRVQASWTSSYTDLAKELDRFLGNTIKHIDRYAFRGTFTASYVFHVLKLVEKSGFCSSGFIEHHVTSLCCTCGNQPPAAVVSFIQEYLRAGQGNLELLAKQLAWFPTIAETWRFMLTPGNPTVQELEKEQPRAIEELLAWSYDEVHQLRRNTSPDDFKNFYAKAPDGARDTQDFFTVLQEVERFLEARLGVAYIIAKKSNQATGENPEGTTYYQALNNAFSSIPGRVVPKRPVVLDSIICIDHLADLIIADQQTSDFPRFSLPAVIGYPKYTSIMTDVGGGPAVPNPFGVSTGKDAGNQGPVLSVRTFFPDTGYWNPRTIVDGGEASMVFKLPDTITRQDFVVQVTSLDCDAGMATKSILVRQEFFIQPDIPPHLVYGDEVAISAVVTNRTAHAMVVDVALDAEGFRIASPSPGKLQVASNGIARVSWTLHATGCGEKHLVFTAAGLMYKDVVDRIIFVHPEGEPDVKITRGFIPAGLPAEARLDVDVAPGEMAHYARLSIIPDRSSLALDGLETMFSYPHGCVEQTMSSVLPNLLVYESLVALNRLTQRYKEKCQDLTSRGLQRLLSFRHDDDGWGWWERDPTNLFMTAYVLRGLLKMKALGFHVPQNVINQALALISRNQTATGAWIPEQALKWDKIASKNSLLLNEAGMTAWILLCISETGDWRVGCASMVESALAFLGSAIDSIARDPNALALAGLAIRRFTPGAPVLLNITYNLKKLKDGSHWDCGSALGGIIDATGKALHFLALQHPKDTTMDVDACVGWILDGRADKGGWGTTMATASVVEAILALQHDGSPALDGDVVVNGRSSRVHVDASNLAEEFINLRNMNVTSLLVPGKNELAIRVTSTRDMHYQLSEETWLKDHLPRKGAYRIERDHSSKQVHTGETIIVSVKVAAVQDVDLCAVIEERIPAGFKLDVEGFEASMKGNEQFDYYTCKPDNITLYPRKANCTFSYSLIASREFSGTHAGTEVYAMYSPGTRGISQPTILEVHKQ